MRALPTWFLSAIALSLPVCQTLSQTQQSRPTGLPSDANVVAFSNRAEDALQRELRKQTPVGEAYLQRFVPAAKIGYDLDEDRYLLGRFNGIDGPRMENLGSDRGLIGRDDASKSIDSQQLLDGMLQVMTPDWKQLLPERYEYTFVKLEFLGAVRCLVYDVKPRNSEETGFIGRIYVENKTWNIVRFTGVSRQFDALFATLRGRDSTFRIDSWRVNVLNSSWVPAYTYIEEVPPLGARQQPLVKGQIRFWGYDSTDTEPKGEFVDVLFKESPSVAEGRKQQWAGPQQSQRAFETQAEENVLNRLSEIRFIGPPNEVEKMLEQVVTNLAISNRFILAEPLRCKVLLTAPLEMFSVGRTIVVSRELINTVPSESALALLLAHQLAHNVLGHRKVDTSFAYPDVLRITDSELLAKLRFEHSDSEEEAANAEALKIVEQSPYKAGMEDGGLFMQAIQARSKQLSALIQPNFGEHVADMQNTVRNHLMFRTTPLRDNTLANQVTAYPLGSKLKVNPMNGRVELFRSELQPAPAIYERAELAVTPFMPFLDYFGEETTVPKPLNATRQEPVHRSRPAAGRSVAPTSAAIAKLRLQSESPAHAQDIAASRK
jgi:hypothetical protein